MATFTNSFFSLSGQKERLTNVVDVLKIAINPVSQQKISATTNSKVVNAATEFVANNAYTTAGLVVGGSSLVKGAATKVTSLVQTGKGAAIVAVGTIGAGAAVAQPTAAIKVASAITPESLAKFGKGIVTDPINAAKNNPILTGALVTVGLIAGSKIVNTVATVQNTNAVERNTNTSSSPPASTDNFEKEKLKLQEKSDKASADLAEKTLKANIELANKNIKLQEDAQNKAFKLQELAIKNAPTVPIAAPVNPIAPASPVMAKPVTKKKKAKKKKKKPVKKKKKPKRPAKKKKKKKIKKKKRKK